MDLGGCRLVSGLSGRLLGGELVEALMSVDAGEKRQTLAGDSGVRVWVPGRSRTKGSLKPVHQRGMAGKPCKVWLREDGEYSEGWKRRMIDWIRAACECRQYAGPVEVHAFFRFEPSAEGPGLTRDQVDTPWPTGRQYGDEDKLRRNLLDALTQSALLADDSLVVGGQTWKRFCREGEEAGVMFVVLPARTESALTLAERWVLGRLSRE
jgi:Holliday junction resolvase RusA-like endonuclease